MEAIQNNSRQFFHITNQGSTLPPIANFHIRYPNILV